jgi:DNA-binding GntR family transcriptional regulator
LRLLAKEGLVTLIPHRGAIVTAISVEMVIDAFSVRAVLEGMAARLAITRLTASDVAQLDAVVHEMELAGKSGDAVRLVEQDIEFHRLLTAACRRPVLLEALGAISNKTYLLITATRYAYPLDRLAPLHAWIVQAVRSGDPDRLEAAVRDHIAYGQHILVSSLGERGETALGHLAALPPSVIRDFEDSRDLGETLHLKIVP